MSFITVVIGKNSNFSKKLLQSLDNVFLVSSRDILQNINILSEFKNKRINIIFNNFHPATHLDIIDKINVYIENTILSTSLILDYFKDSNINKIIYTSSSSVYGNNILCEETDDLKPMNLHASLKISNEKLVEKYCKDNNIDYTITRIFNMYGGNDTFSVISKIINSYKYSKELTIVNNGNAIRDFIHIDDVVSIYKQLLNIKNLKVLNIGTGSGNSIKGVLDFLLYNGIKIKINNIFKDELKISTSNSKLLKKIIGKYDFINIEEYLKKEFVI